MIDKGSDFERNRESAIPDKKNLASIHLEHRSVGEQLHTGTIHEREGKLHQFSAFWKYFHP